MTESFQDVPVVFRGKPATAQARLKPDSEHVEIASIRFDDERDERGVPPVKTYAGHDPKGEADKVYALSALPEEERQDLFRQVKAALSS